jgi:hypothetical protein
LEIAATAWRFPSLRVLPANNDSLALLTFVAGNATGEIVGVLNPLVDDTGVVDEGPGDGKRVAGAADVFLHNGGGAPATDADDGDLAFALVANT